MCFWRVCVVWLPLFHQNDFDTHAEASAWPGNLQTSFRISFTWEKLWHNLPTSKHTQYLMSFEDILTSTIIWFGLVLQQPFLIELQLFVAEIILHSGLKLAVLGSKPGPFVQVQNHIFWGGNVWNSSLLVAKWIDTLAVSAFIGRELRPGWLCAQPHSAHYK